MATAKAVVTEPTIADLIAEAQLADEAAQAKADAIKTAQNEAEEASAAARATWDKLYLELVRIKEQAGHSPSFKQSQLGRLLLNGIR